jgi:UDP-GlcNAc:undecaprenyl-phosphate/decaprenyl-phosphate GlcNAc-1-phosphate transferase
MGIFDSFIGRERSLFWLFNFWPVLAAAIAAGLGATFVCKKLALKYGITDKPDDTVKTHKEPVAYLGGIGILFGFGAGVAAGIMIIIDQGMPNESIKWLVGVLAGAVIACLVGVVDDLFDIKPWQKLLGQFTAALAIIASGISPCLSYFTMHTIGQKMPPEIDTILSFIVIVVFVLGATNSLNLLDGLDGLCGGVTAIIAIAMLILAAHLATWATSETGDPVRIILCLGLVGGVFGFLPFNRHPAKIFMGDAGSLLLGFVIASLMILYGETIPRWWLASIVVFGLPILDTATALVRRKLNGRPLMQSDRGHIYDQMMDRGMGLRKTVAMSYLLTAVYAVIGLLMSQVKTRHALVVYLLVVFVSGFIVWKKGFLKMEGLRGAKQK